MNIVLPETQALIRGALGGKMQLSGESPSPGTVGGGGSNMYDPAAHNWDSALKEVSKLSAVLHNQNRQVESNKVAKLAVQLQHLALEARKKIAENAVSSNAMSAASGIQSKQPAA